VGHFYVAVDRFRHTEDLWAIFVHGPFWYRSLVISW